MAGIYLIECLATGAKYVGQTRRPFAARWQQHRTALKAGKHHNKLLQRDWNIFGGSNFKFSVLIACAPDPKLLDRLERQWTRILDASYSYSRDVLGLPRSTSFYKKLEPTITTNDRKDILQAIRAANPYIS